MPAVTCMNATKSVQKRRKPATGWRGLSGGGFLAPNRWHSEQGNTRKQNYLLPPLWGGAGGQSGDPAPNSLTRYAVPWNVLGSAYKESYAQAAWRELGAIDQLLGGIVIGQDWQKRRDFFKSVNV